jgi:hypothetical protein
MPHVRRGKRQRHTENGNGVLLAIVAALDTKRRGTRDFGSLDSGEGEGEGVDDGDEV